jgi:hypothetical protein
LKARQNRINNKLNEVKRPQLRALLKNLLFG